MRRHLLRGLAAAAILSLFATGGCGGRASKIPQGTNRVPLPPIDFTITLPANAGIAASAVSYERLRLQEALNMERTPSDLPTDFRMVEAFVIRPETTVLPAAAHVRLVPEESLPAGTRLFLFRVSASRHCTPVDDGFVAEDGSITFETMTFGFFIVAENTLITRPSDTFLCFAFANIAEGPLPLTVDLYAISFGGADPITYTWNMGDGTEELTGAQIAHTFYDVGDYTVTVFATDAAGTVSNSYSTIISVTNDYIPLQSVDIAYIMPTDAAKPYERHFIPSLTGGVPPFSWSWEFTDGYTATEQDPIHDFSSAGLYSGTVSVTDAALDTVSADFIVDLRRINLEVVPTFGYSPMEASFTITADGVGSGATVVLDYGDGERESVDLSSGLIYLHRYDNPGTYPAYVEAWENYEGNMRYVYSADVYIVTVEAPVPIIYSIFPAQAARGEQVTVFGVDFGSFQNAGDIVRFTPTADAVVADWTDTAIKVTVPDTAVDGDVVVSRTDQGTAYTSNPMYFNVVEPGQPQPPVITLLSPGRGPVGTKVTILGINFGDTQLTGDNASIGYLNMDVLSWSTNAIEAEIPQYALTDNVVVRHSGMLSNPVLFDVGNYLIDDPPAIDSISPTSGIRGSIVTIHGTSFGAYLPDSIVFIGGIPMAVVNWTDIAITVLVPAEALDGDIRVFQNGGLSNPAAYKIVPVPPNIYGTEQI